MTAAGAMMGFALGIKYLALLPLVFLAGLALMRKLPLRGTLAFVMVAVVIGSPWYIKNVVWMRNPVYPFAYSIFPGGAGIGARIAPVPTRTSKEALARRTTLLSRWSYCVPGGYAVEAACRPGAIHQQSGFHLYFPDWRPVRRFCPFARLPTA